MYLQLHLHERKLLLISNMLVAYSNANRSNNIHWDSLAQWQFRLYKLPSRSANLLGFTNFLNLTAFSYSEMSLID